jgi:hypothetical protein
VQWSLPLASIDYRELSTSEVGATQMLRDCKLAIDWRMSSHTRLRGIRTTRCVHRMALLVVMGRRRSPSFPQGACIRDGSLRIGARIRQTRTVQQYILGWFRAKTRDRIWKTCRRCRGRDRRLTTACCGSNACEMDCAYRSRDLELSVTGQGSVESYMLS